MASRRNKGKLSTHEQERATDVSTMTKKELSRKFVLNRLKVIIFLYICNVIPLKGAEPIHTVLFKQPLLFLRNSGQMFSLIGGL